MKLTIWMVLAGTAFCAQAAEWNRELAAGRDLYIAAEFGKAATIFQVLCNEHGDAEACYWAGVSYERLADTRMPFGCRTSAKAHVYLRKAVNLAPDVAIYRDALFDFLLDNGDCSRTALQEAVSILAEMPETCPQFELMRIRLEHTRHQNGSVDARLAKLFLIIPRSAYDSAAGVGSALQLAARPK